MKGILDFIRELVQTPSQNGIDSEKDLGGKKEHFFEHGSAFNVSLIK